MIDFKIYVYKYYPECKHEISGAESKAIISFYKSFLISVLLFLLLVTALVLCPSSFLLLGEMVR